MASVLVGFWAGSIALIGFGLDSFVESFLGAVMIWRFAKRKNLSQEEEQQLESKATKFVGYTFFALGAYVLYESVKKLYFRGMASPSLAGIIIAVVSAVLMPTLFYWKYRTGKSLNSRSLVADSKETLACFFLSLALLVGLSINYVFGLWQADPILGLIIVAFLTREGYEVLRGKE